MGLKKSTDQAGRKFDLAEAPQQNITPSPKLDHEAEEIFRVSHTGKMNQVPTIVVLKEGQ